MTPTPDQREKALERLSQIEIQMRALGQASPVAISEIRAALTAPPQVPQEVVDALRDLRGCCNLPPENQYKWRCMVKADEALALLTQGRE